MTEADRPSVPSLPAVIRRSMAAALRAARTAIPARVESYDPDEGTVAAKPLMRHVEDVAAAQDPVEYPVVSRVPVCYPRWGGFVLRLPIHPGDVVTLLVSDRELETWLSGTGAIVTPRSDRILDKDDAMAIPGPSPWGSPASGLSDDCLVIGREDGEGELRIRQDGTIYLGSADGEGGRRPVARKEDGTVSSSQEDTAFWAWVTAVDAALRAGSAVPGGGAAITAAYSASVPPGNAPSQQTGRITDGSPDVEVE